MSPILVRPVREQLEHDRIIRLLQAKSRRRFEAGMNPGNEHNVPVGTGPAAVYPDLVLQSPERGRRLQAIVEVETGESVNHLEALAQWAHFAKLRAPFHLYVPSGMVDVARRLCEDNQIHVNEIWSYHTIGDEVRFTLVHRAAKRRAGKERDAAHGRGAKPVPPPKRAVRSAAKTAREAHRQEERAPAPEAKIAVPFVRFSRDRRGYEHVYLVDVVARQSRPLARPLLVSHAARASRSVATPSIRTRSARSKRRIRTSRSTGRRSSRARMPPPAPWRTGARSGASSGRSSARGPTDADEVEARVDVDLAERDLASADEPDDSMTASGELAR